MQKLVFLFLIIFSHLTLAAGIASAPFGPVNIAINPAVASFRSNGAFGVSANFKEIKSDLDLGAGTTIQKNINISKYDLIFAGKDSWFVPEFYISPQNSTKVISGEQSKSTNKNNFINNQLNLALRPTSYFSIGIKQIYPTLTITNSSDTTTSQGNYQYSFKAKYTFLGTGVGAILKLGPLYMGGEFFKSNLTRDVVDSGTLKRGLKKMAFGAALVFGSPRNNAFRLEGSYEKMIQESVPSLSLQEEKGKVLRGELEFVTRGYYGSLALVYRKDAFLDFSTLIEDLLYQERMSEGSTTYTWGMGFKPDKGHSLGAKLSYSKTQGMETVTPDSTSKYPSKTTEFAYGVNYSFVF